MIAVPIDSAESDEPQFVPVPVLLLDTSSSSLAIHQVSRRVVDVDVDQFPRSLTQAEFPFKGQGPKG